MNSFSCLPESILLKIFSYVTNDDLCTICEVSTQFKRLALDRSLVRFTDYEGKYESKETKFEEYANLFGYNIEHLNLNHCYWMSGKSVAAGLKKCRNIKHLSLMDINLTAKKLIKILSGLSHLVSLAFTVANIDEFDNELMECEEAQKTMQRIQELTIHFKVPLSLRSEVSISVQFLQKKKTFFEHCRDLESFHVIGHPNLVCGLPKLLLQPNVEKMENLKNLKAISLNYAIDPAARIFYYGTLLSVAKLHLKMKTVLNPSANFEPQIRPDFWNLFWKSQHQLENLDISSISLEKIFTHVFDPGELKPNLRFLNLSGTYRTAAMIPGCDLTSVVCVCPNLTSLNLRQSHIIFLSQLAPKHLVIDVEGIAQLATSCQRLSHLNISGAHVHDVNAVKILMSRLKGLKSFSLSPCCCAAVSAKVDYKVKFDPSLVGDGATCVEDDAPPGKRRRLDLDSIEAVPSTSSKCSDFDGATSSTSQSDSTCMSCGLEDLVEGCPEMEQFEMINAGLTKPVVHRGQYGLMPKPCVYKHCLESSMMTDSKLMCIGQWKHLRYLQLAGLPGVMTGTCLVSIATGCEQLEQLHLAYLGLTGHCNFKHNLLKAFPQFRMLKDFRLEHNYVPVDVHFCKAAQSCSGLQRLCVVSRGGTIHPGSVIDLMANRPTLTVLQLFTDVTQTVCKKLQKSIKDRFGVERPALSVTIWPLFDQETPSVMNNIPTKHLEELTIYSSKVCERPPGWKW